MKRKRKEPDRTFVLRISPEGRPMVWRTVELSERQTLHQLHNTIVQAFSLRGRHLYAFYLSGKRWDTDTEYGGPSAASARKANKTELAKLELEKGTSFAYVFDLDRENWFSLECMDQQTSVPKTSYPRILDELGEMPPATPPIEDGLPAPLKTLVNKLAPTLRTWNLARAKPRGPKDVAEARDLLKGIARALSDRGPGTWAILERCTDLLLADWLASLPADLAKRGFPDEALRLCDAFAPFCDEILFNCEKALVYAHLGKKQRTLQQIRENLTRHPESPQVVAKAAEAFWKLEEAGHAERLYRKALDLAADDLNQRERILEKMLTMLDENEREEEAIELVQSELDRG